MDLQTYNRLAHSKIISGEMIRLVLDTQKQKARARAIELDQQRTQMEPLFDKLDELKESFDRIQKKDTEDPTIVIQQDLDYDRDFTNEEIDLLQEQNLGSPSEIIAANQEQQALNLINTLNQSLGQKKKSRKKISRGNYIDIERKLDVNRKLRDRLKRVEGIKRSRVQNIQAGSGLSRALRVPPPIFTSPDEILQRFELLGGSLAAGNNSTAVKKEFSKIAHKLRDLNILNNSQLLGIAKKFKLDS